MLILMRIKMKLNSYEVENWTIVLKQIDDFWRLNLIEIWTFRFANFWNVLASSPLATITGLIHHALVLTARWVRFVAMLFYCFDVLMFCYVASLFCCVMFVCFVVLSFSDLLFLLTYLVCAFFYSLVQELTCLHHMLLPGWFMCPVSIFATLDSPRATVTVLFASGWVTTDCDPKGVGGGLLLYDFSL